MSLPATVFWSGDQHSIRFDSDGTYAVLEQIDQPCFVVRADGKIGLTAAGSISGQAGFPLLAWADPVLPAQLGSPAFRQAYGVRSAYMAGAMANGIASEDMVIALARAGYLASFGAAGLLPERIERALVRFRQEIPNAVYCSNLIHSPIEEALERNAVDLYLRYGLRQIEASAFMNLTPHIVRYRLAGLQLDPSQRIITHNHVVAKVSRPEVAEKFLSPAPPEIVRHLLETRQIPEEQARLASHVSIADDITVEGDSGGHTDRRPLVSLFPSIRDVADRLRQRFGFIQQIRIGAAGGIGTPAAACAAFAMGADYIVTGSINQSAIESGSSPIVKRLLAQSGIADCEMAPAADMFEMGVKVQVLKRGVLFPMRGQKLYDIYRTYESLETIPAAELSKLETDILRRPVSEIWRDVEDYFTRRDPAQLERAQKDGKRRMGLVFRWYLGMSSRWANTGDPARVMDYQIWCGPAMGSFNHWVKGSALEDPQARKVADLADLIMRGAAFHARINRLRLQGVALPSGVTAFRAPAQTGCAIAA